MSAYREAFASIEDMARQQMAASHTPGLVMALTDRERTFHIAALGLEDLAAQQPVSPAMLFEIGSIGKSFTAFIFMQLAAEGKIDLHQPVAHYLPWFAMPSPFPPITLHHLLSHTAGITMGTDFAPSAVYEPYALRQVPVVVPPGERFHYSNVGYKTLGYVLEAVTGQSYRDLLQERILDPLGMLDTDGVTTHASRLRMATGYVPLYDDQPFHRELPQIPAPWLEYSCADGSPAAPVEDMARYARMLLQRGAGIVAPEQFAQMIQPIGDMGNGHFYGYGLVSEMIDGRAVAGHGGGTVGFNTCLLTDQDDGLGVMLMANGRCPLYQIARFALAQLHAANHDLPLPEVPAPADPRQIAHAEEYSGVYGDGLTLVAEDSRLLLVHGDERITLEQRGGDAFYVPHPAWRRFLLRFTREGGQIVAATHGTNWYPAAGTSASAAPTTPPAWAAYLGRYRSHNPWFSNFTIVLRRGQLLFISPDGPEDVLHPVDAAWFRVGASPELIRFDAVAGGHALRANYSGGDFYWQNR